MKNKFVNLRIEKNFPIFFTGLDCKPMTEDGARKVLRELTETLNTLSIANSAKAKLSKEELEALGLDV